MTTSFYNGISGLISFQSGLDIWGDNIANVNTPAFKQTNPEFATIFSQTLNESASPTSDIGYGSYLNSTAKDMGIGSFQKTDNPFDIAIAGHGWFAVQNKGETFYTRDGAFTRDALGYLTNDNGEYLLVANAHNLVEQNGQYIVDRNIDTSKLLPTTELSPISLPDNVTIPAVATKNVTLKANLNDDNVISTTKPASGDIDMSALYSKDGEDLKIRNDQSLVFGFGNKVTYDKGNLISNICFNDDNKDGNDVNIDFTLNGKEIKLTLPDGSTKDEIASAVADALNKAGFQATATNGEVTITTQNEFILQSNTPGIENTAAAVLTYKDQKENQFDFSTLDDFVNDIQTLAKDAYGDKIDVSLDSDGEIVVTNHDLKNTLHSYVEKTEDSNEAFLENLSKVGNDIYPDTTNKSYPFLVNSQDFGGNIIDQDGNKIPVTINFTKEKVQGNTVIWNGTITIHSPDGDKSTTQQFIFNSDGALLSPTEIKFDNIDFKFDMSAFSKVDSNGVSYSFTQDGIEDGYLKNYEITDDGKIIGVFSNSEQVTFGQIPVFHFQNEQGLANIGGNDYTQTSNSGKAFLYTDKDGNYIPTKILSSMLETSNVNFSQAMTELIITQKAFQASAKTVTTSDEMIQRAINMKR